MIKYMIKKILILVVILVITPSCSEDTKSSVKNINKLEMIAIKVDKPQAHAGDGITAEALVGHPEDYNDEFHTIWLLCNPIGTMGVQSCMTEGGIIGLPTIDSHEFNFTVPNDTLSSQNLESKNLYAIFIICEADMDTCQNAMMSEDAKGFDSDIFKVSYKTVEVIKDDSPIVNHNPKIKSIYLNGVELPSDSIILDARAKGENNSSDNIFKAEVTSDSFDEIKTPKGEKDYESIAFAWRSTLGSIDYYYTDQKHDETIDDLDDNPFQTALSTENNSYRLYVIALDSRGGIDWKIINIKSK